MNGITILIWITIVIIGVIACILVKLHYKGNELEQDEGSIIPSTDKLNGILSQGKEKINSKNLTNSLSSKTTRTQNSQNTKSLYGNKQHTSQDYDVYIVPEVNNKKTYEYESENQVLIDYGDKVKKFQEPIKQSQMDIMNQNKDDKTELKDLFTIDELIKESKRKDNEREKEQPKVEDSELTELKESIAKKQENTIEKSSIEEDIGEFETIESLLNEEELNEDETSEEIETSTTSQKTIEEAISSASQEKKEEIENLSENENITDVLLHADDDQMDIPNEEIKEPTLKTPTKVDESNDSEFNSPLKEDNEETMDLDYRKDLDKFTQKIKGSKLFKDVKEKLTAEPEEYIEEGIPKDETYIRNVKEYDDFEPIINETHADYVDPIGDIEPAFEDNQSLKLENKPKAFEVIKDSSKPEVTQQKIPTIKSKPSRNNIKIKLNNNEVVLKKGDEIIFNHLGETYSSQVYAINGDDISVKYRRQNIIIKPADVKKIY
ncbi:hypothetical protein [Methanobrevibacter gottschalkii]|uniref:hypothetical protein n=1 Tax=Methanobrevibacter gottschalkii TaxID=190974 RepID=UPI0038CFD88C